MNKGQLVYKGFSMECKSTIGTIGIDFDDTISLNPEMFKDIINIFKKNEFSVIIVTARNHNDFCDLLNEFKELVDRIIFTNGVAKEDVVSEFNINIDIWIDDTPICITHSFDGDKFVPGNKILKSGWL